MATEEQSGLDYVPEYLPDAIKERLIALTRESESEPAPLAVDEYLIRHWCETLEDGNPLYLDRDFARSRGFDDLVAPPGAVMTTFALPFRWPWPPAEREPARHIHYDVKELLDLPVGIIQNIEIETGVPLQVGDRVSVSQRLVSISPAGRGCPMVPDELAPLSIERLDDTESSPPARCARHGYDFAQRVLSSVLVETPLVLPIWARCCQ